MKDLRRNISKKDIKEVTVVVPAYVIEELYIAGYEHSMRGGNLTKREHFKASFRLGFRTAKLELKEIRRRRGIIDFPMNAKVKMTIKWKD